MWKSGRLCTAGFVLFFALADGVAGYAQSLHRENLIIHSPKPYTPLVSQIQKLGGKVNRQYEYIDAVAVDIPESALPDVINLVGDDAISKDSVVAVPKAVLRLRNAASRNVVPQADSDIYTSAAVGAGTRIFPVSPGPGIPSNDSYQLNYANLKLRDLHARGFTGKDVVVAVIDSGVRTGYFSLDSDGSIIGGEDLVGDGRPYNSPQNDPHGTFVSTLISGNARFSIPNGTFRTSLDMNFPGALETTGNVRTLPVIGSAPEASIYMIRVIGVKDSDGNFPPTPKSRIMAAIERVITLRQNFERFGKLSAANPKGGLNIKVCNLSIGTSTINAGNEPLEQLIDKLLDNDIVPVIAAGDGGLSSLTIASPATSFSALAVGATNPAANDRLENDVFYDQPGAGAVARPTTYTQTAFFSSRGPTADGRILPDVMAAGFDVLSQGCGGLDSSGNCRNDPNNIEMANGTSFSAPIVAGIAAILRQEFPKATATQISNAIVQTADDKQLGDGSTVLDQGQGVVNASAAAALLQSGKVSDRQNKQRYPDSSVENNIEDNTRLRVDHGVVTESFKNLKAGQRAEILYAVDETTSEVDVDFSIKLGKKQNQKFGDDLFVFIQSAKTSSGATGDYFVPGIFLTDETTVTTIPIQNPEPGIIRITVMGDYTNVSNVSTDIHVTSTHEPLPKTSASGTIKTGDSLIFPIDVPDGVLEAQFQLRWSADWGHYPTNDLDMHLFDPSGNEFLGPDGNQPGATLSDPEEITVPKPSSGKWTLQVLGFAVSTKKDNFELSVTLDGKTVVPKKQK